MATYSPSQQRALDQSSEADINRRAENREKIEAHTRLVNAAPALYDALDRLTGEVIANCGAFESEIRRAIGHTNYTALVERVDAARAAIARATGAAP